MKNMKHPEYYMVAFLAILLVDVFGTNYVTPSWVECAE